MSLKIAAPYSESKGTEDTARVNRGRVRTASGGLMLLNCRMA